MNKGFMQGQSKYKAMKGITAIFKHFSSISFISAKHR